VSLSESNTRVILDLNNQTFQENLFSLQKTERHAVLDTLSKIRQLTWQQVYKELLIGKLFDHLIQLDNFSPIGKF
jgi:hypothetical protein